MDDDVAMWRMMPGHGASDWKEWQAKGCISIGWADFDDLRRFGDFGVLDRFLRKRGGEGAKLTRRTIVPFIEQMQVGDIVIVGGVSNVYGIGTIASDYLPKADPANPLRDSAHPHARRVEWHSTTAFKLSTGRFTRNALQRVKAEQWALVRRTLARLRNGDDLRDFDKRRAGKRARLNGAEATVLRDIDAEGLEGEQRRSLIAHYQRDSRLRQTFIATRATLACEVCGFDFSEAFGELGAGYAHVHHEDPLAARRKAKTTRHDRLKVVCANCHAMIHRGGECRSLDEVRAAQALARQSSADA